MTAPAQAGQNILWGLALGAIFGCWYDFWRTPGRAHPHLADLARLIVLIWLWLELSFGICGGDLRLGYTASLGVGWGIWELTLGKLVSRVFDGFWAGIIFLFRLVTRPLQIFVKIFFKKSKKTICICEKMGYNKME